MNIKPWILSKIYGNNVPILFSRVFTPIFQLLIRTVISLFYKCAGFRDIVYVLENQFITFSYVHAGNSMGLGDYKSDLFNLARPGIMLYGIYPMLELKEKIHLKPVMSVKTKIIFVQPINKGQGISYGHTFKAKEDMTVAVLPIGYSNGFLRSLIK